MEAQGFSGSAIGGNGSAAGGAQGHQRCGAEEQTGDGDGASAERGGRVESDNALEVIGSPCPLQAEGARAGRRVPRVNGREVRKGERSPTVYLHVSEDHPVSMLKRGACVR